MNIERKIVVHLSAWDIISSLRQTHPTILGLQAMHDAKAKVVMEVGSKVLVLTYTIPGSAPVSESTALVTYGGGGSGSSDVA